MDANPPVQPGRMVVTEVGGAGLFARQSTGLVREVSPLSTYIFNVIAGVPPIVLAISIFWTLGAYPGANLYIAYWLAFVAAVAIALGIGLVSSAMPRTGGDYILVSRIIHPAVGLISSFCETAGVILSIAFWGLGSATVASGPALISIGLIANSPTLISWGNTVESSHWWQFAIGMGVFLLSAFVVSGGWRRYLRFQNGAFILVGIGLLLTGITLLIAGGDSFISHFNSFSRPITQQPDTYHTMIAAAQKAGINTHPGFSVDNTWPAVGAVMGFLVYNWISIYIAGEVRRANTWQIPLTMVASALTLTVILTVLTWIFFNAFGGDFFTAANALSGSSDYPFAAPPYYVFLTSIAGGSILLALILWITFAISFPMITYNNFMVPVRTLFAYAFDGLVPMRVSHVSRRHAPTVALAVVFVLNAAVFAWAVFGGTGFFTVFAVAILFSIVPITLLGVVGIVLPFRRPDAWRASATTRTVAGIPIVSIAGAATVIASLFDWFFFLHYPGLGVTNPGAFLISFAVLAVLALAFYYGARLVRARQGMDLTRTYGEIPPE